MEQVIIFIPLFNSNIPEKKIQISFIELQEICEKLEEQSSDIREKKIQFWKENTRIKTSELTVSLTSEIYEKIKTKEHNHIFLHTYNYFMKLAHEIE